MAAPFSRFADVDTPSLLLDLDRVERNVDRYQTVARAAGLRLRPHAKAHKTVELARLQIERGAAGVCAAKLGEAEALVAGGIQDILVTTPVVGPLKIARLVALARSARLTVVVDDAANVAELARAAGAGGVTLDVLVDVDIGQGRTGVPPGPKAAHLAAAITGPLVFRGLQGYQGKLQAVAALADRRALVEEAMQRLARSRDAVRAAGLDCAVLSGGGTGSFPIDVELKVLTELQPGSYVTMDTAYAKVALAALGDAHPLGHPLTILTSVISRPTDDRAVVDVGWKAASNDGGIPVVQDRPDLTFEFAGDEHGIVRSISGPLTLAPGERLALVPSHCDTTVNLHDRFVVHRAGRVEGHWPIVARGRTQ